MTLTSEVRDHYVYRLFDASGQLLYIGVTRNLRLRESQHRSEKPWWPAVVRKELHGPLPLQDAYAAENQAILTERPLHNVAVRPPLVWVSDAPYVGAQEIARMFGVGRQRVQQLVTRPDFPAPVVTLAMGKVWHADDVRLWARERGRVVHEESQQ